MKNKVMDTIIGGLILTLPVIVIFWGMMTQYPH